MYRKVYLLKLFALFCAATTLCQSPGTQQERKRAGMLNDAYAALRAGPERAIPLFREFLRVEPLHVGARRQLGFLYLSVGNKDSALVQFTRAEALSPSDSIRLQIAYLLDATGNANEAYAAFTALRSSRDARIRDQAKSASLVLGPTVCAHRSSWWTRVAASPSYDTRFRDAVFTGSLSHGYSLPRAPGLSVYGTLGFTRDTRSTGGTLPVLYSDNFVLFAAGMRAQPFPGFSADAQAGIATDLIKRPETRSTQGDFRFILSYGNGVYPPVRIHDHASWPCSFFADAYSSLGYYTRYHDVIGYAVGRAGFRLVEERYFALDVYGRGDFVGDTDRQFYNNIVEGGGGVRIIPDQRWGVSILAEYHRGTYWGSAKTPNPYGPTYNTVRISLVLDRFLCL